MSTISGWQWRVKRLLDVLVAGGALLVLAPAFLVLAIAIKLDSAGPIVFADDRVGRHGRPFRMLKFRSMVDKASAGPLGYKMVPRDPRITRVGRLIRRFSIDELPQLLNILIGDMSLIGPRPMLPAHLPHLDSVQRRRFAVRPGLTGWAQVNGRNTITWEDRIRLDLEYMDRYSLWLDFRILLATVQVVLRGGALYSEIQQRDAL